MYNAYFGFKERPFAITPDPQFVYLSKQHTEALAHLVYGITEGDGFIVLTGEVGTGKTTLLRYLLNELPKKVDIALILNPRLSGLALIRKICTELKIDVSHGDEREVIVDKLNAYLLDAHARGRRTVLVIDEAQNLDVQTLEEIRLLTNLETSKDKLLQIVLAGQPELRELLQRKDLRQLAQRITSRYHLNKLDQEDIHVYLDHRLKAAGCTRKVFSVEAEHIILQKSGGIPRVINLIADRALLGAFANNQPVVSSEIAKGAAQEIFANEGTSSARTGQMVAAVAVTAVFFLVVLFFGLMGRTNNAEESAALIAVAASDSPDQAASASMSLTDLLAESGLDSSTDSAFEQLFSLWGAIYAPESRAPCAQATALGLACQFQDSDIALLSSLNRPAIIVMQDTQGREYHSVIKSLDGDKALLLFSDKEHLVSVSELNDYWNGESLLLWRPAYSGKLLVPGVRVTAVENIRDQLESYYRDIEVKESNREFYDFDLADVVRRLQREFGLEADGIIGVHTQIALNTARNAIDTPHLKVK